jgi:hypothetical protein
MHGNVWNAVVVGVIFRTITDLWPHMGSDLRVLFQVDIQLSDQDPSDLGMFLRWHLRDNFPVHEFI